MFFSNVLIRLADVSKSIASIVLIQIDHKIKLRKNYFFAFHILYSQW